ncbi:NACHT, LRR and PYD domains-containing protein 1 homolog [Megalobrama amblycephala]|uniref:NACHT, LRR and PYD domains-containing protein 1 homolog n=1 Tax=Megalobrama amblycephala TaxID=75352 RepID=UPI002013D188|nr:NACHT, LRR and PYD domains-containing protein 1 homolog [Megalobrama amblycephala]
MDTSDQFCSNNDILRSHAGPNVSVAAQSGSHVTTPVLTNNTITGNVNIIHNAPGFTCFRPHSEKTPSSAIRSLILKYKKLICNEYQYVTEYNSLPGEHVLLSERYTQPLIIQRYRNQKEREEEISSSGESFQQVLSSRSSDESVHLNSLFNPDDHRISPSAVILQGNSGNGKSFTVQKIMMDWASGDLYKGRFDIVFHLMCKEINRISDKKSLVEILSYSCSLTSNEISQILQQSPEKVLFIIDGFDELIEDIYPMTTYTDPLQEAPPVVTLNALLRGHILPESFLLVTTRSTATDTLSKLLKGPQRFTEIMGFSEKGVEEYFHKFFKNNELFRKAYERVRANETLITACSIPVICWIICTVMRERLSDGVDVTSGLETTTSIYIDFMSTLLEHHCQGLSQSIPTLLRSLGKLAERGIVEQQVLFDEKTVYGTVSDPAGNPFLCKVLFKRKIHQETMFSFMHLSFQEFFTALYYISLDSETLKEKITEMHYGRCEAVRHFLFGLLNKEVRKTLKRKYGVCVDPNIQHSLKEILPSTQPLSILHCLYELHEQSFVKDILSTKHIFICYKPLRRADCWALLYCCQCCQRIKELTIYCCRFMSENMSMIVPVLHKFEKVTLTPETQPDSALVDLMHDIIRGKTQNSLSVRIELAYYSHPECRAVSLIDLSVSEELSRITIHPQYCELRSFSLTFQPDLPNIDWASLFQALTSQTLMFFLPCLSGLKKIEMEMKSLTKTWAIQIIFLSKNCPSLTEVRTNVCWIPEEGIKVLQKAHIRPGCALTFEGCSCQTECSYGTICKKRVQINLHAGGFFTETLRPSLFPS